MQLRIDSAAVNRCRSLAAAVVAPVAEFIAGHSTVAVERSVLRLLGIDGVAHDEIPLPNAILDGLAGHERDRGIALPF
ncbi:MAG: D-lysine 5,6-aminomutase subunit alpha, partial [Candidatus Eremiobacteraeota bacterium]|nr:D-lysine 5,6-aminomutase subunit alpha [Candidatus Eremiobacteraeota bacterium]